MKWTKEKLIEFENKIIKSFENKEIKGPVHLSGGNEEALIDIFKNIKEDDYVFSTWRSHYHALLHGVPEEYVYNECLNSNSISIQYPQKNFYTSAIVGGIIPIATGVALSLKRSNSDKRVYCFIGDMAASMGIANECMRFVFGYDLPITFIIENNGLSVDTPVDKSWGIETKMKNVRIIEYDYKRLYPHQGYGKWVTF